MAKPIVMPKQGNTVESCTIVKWHKKKGEPVKEKEPLFTYETDKATFDFESPYSGTLIEIFCSDDSTVPVLSNVAAIGNPGEDVASLKPAAAPAPIKSGQTAPGAPSQLSNGAQQQFGRAVPAQQSENAGISPRARAFARAKGVDVSVAGRSGPGGRTIERDVVAAFQSGTPLTRSAWAQVAAGGGHAPEIGSGIGGRARTNDLIAGDLPKAVMVPEGTYEQKKISGIRSIIANRMMQSLQETAQLTMHISANATNLLAYRKAKKGAGFALADIILTAFALTRVLQKFPEINSLLLGDTLYRYKSVHLALAVDTPRGLLVPVIRDAERLSLKELTTAIMTVSTKCNNGTISPDLLNGGTITLTPLGAFGIESFTPVLNTPQVAILGLNAIVPRPVLDATGEYIIAPHIGLSLTIDHQAVDGAPAARFLKAMVDAIENINQTLVL